MEEPVDKIELLFHLSGRITYVKVILVKKGVKTVLASVPVLSTLISVPLVAKPPD